MLAVPRQRRVHRPQQVGPLLEQRRRRARGLHRREQHLGPVAADGRHERGRLLELLLDFDAFGGGGGRQLARRRRPVLDRLHCASLLARLQTTTDCNLPRIFPEGEERQG